MSWLLFELIQTRNTAQAEGGCVRPGCVKQQEGVSYIHTRACLLGEGPIKLSKASSNER